MFGKLLEGKSGSAEATEAVGKVGDLHPDAPVCLAALPRVWPRRAGAGTTKGCSVAKRAYRRRNAAHGSAALAEASVAGTTRRTIPPAHGLRITTLRSA